MSFMRTPHRRKSSTAPTPEQLRLREIEVDLRKLDDENRDLAWPVTRLKAQLGRFPTRGEEEAEIKACLPRRRQLLAAMKVLRNERKALKQADRDAREARALANRLAKQSARESVTAECQICEGRQCLNRDGTMVHHGYQRPGDGMIFGDCFGVKRLPYPETDALEEYLGYILRRQKSAEFALADLPGRTEIFVAGRFPGEKSKNYIKSETDPRTWEQVVKNCQWTLEEELRWFDREVLRVKARIATAKEVQS